MILQMAGLGIVIISFVGLMIAPYAAFVPGVGFLAANAWWLLPLGLFVLLFGLSRNIVISALITAVIYFILKFVVGVI